MGLFNQFPYTNFHEMNLDWILQQLRELVDEWDAYGTDVSATAVSGEEASVTVEGSLKDELKFDFVLPRGEQGVRGLRGEKGDKGDTGNGLEILDVYPTLADLQTAHPTGTSGDAYLIGTGGSYVLYIWSDSSSAWIDGGSLTSPAPSTSAPLMDGTAAAGSAVTYARADHVHPSDNSKLDITDYTYDTTVLDTRLNGIEHDIGDLQSADTGIINRLDTDEQDISDLTDAVENLKVLVVTTSAVSSLPHTVTDSDITSSMIVINSTLSNPSSQIGDWSVTTSSGSLSISGTITGSTDITLYLAEQR